MKLKIVYEDAPENPYEAWDMFGTIITKGGWLGEKAWGSKKEIEEFLEDKVWLPIYRYSHSGTTISTSPFSSSWDSGLTGWIYATKEQVDDEFGGDKERAKGVLQGVIDVMDTYVRGEVYGFIVKDTCECCDQETEMVDSCWGFYGDESKDQIRDHLSHLGNEVLDQLDDAWEARHESL